MPSKRPESHLMKILPRLRECHQEHLKTCKNGKCDADDVQDLMEAAVKKLTTLQQNTFHSLMVELSHYRTQQEMAAEFMKNAQLHNQKPPSNNYS